MSDLSRTEKERAAGEARDAVASRPAGASAAAVVAAMRRYLRAEQYHERKDGDDHLPAIRSQPSTPTER